VAWIRFVAAIFAGRFLIGLLRLLGRKATTLPGAVALRICPSFFRFIGTHYKGRIILITGTNGKTTTSNMTRRLLESAGYRVVSNSLGANLVSGVATAWLEAFHRPRASRDEVALFEVDEATIGKIVNDLAPAMIVVTNFFRDQMDRYGELDTVVDMVADALARSPADTVLVLNADDPLVWSIRRADRETVTFGIDAPVGDGLQNPAVRRETQEMKDGKFCRRCGHALVYERYVYGQLGAYSCPSCDFARPRPQVAATLVRQTTGGIDFRVEGLEAHLASPGIYNVYNALAAIAAARRFGVPDEVLRREVKRLRTALGRMEPFEIGGRSVLLSLVKNPAGCSEVVKVAASLGHFDGMLFVLNDRYADGTDISWIWDADFSPLQDIRAGVVVCAGTRGAEIALRLKYAGWTAPLRVAEGDIAALDGLLEATPPHGRIFVFTTYTSLYVLRDHLEALAAPKADRRLAAER
jgi:UDP-N-acetylmuramyl tripeptide synthase